MTRSEIQNGYQISSDGKTVWVNSPKGMCVGRFTRNHVDTHHDLERQLEGNHCLDCFSGVGKPVTDSWEHFKNAMSNHYSVTIPEVYKPKEGRK